MAQQEAIYDSTHWIAITLSLFAGLATALGGSIVYFTKCVTLANQSFLSAALGFSAGVMIFISFFELLVDSKEHFLSSGMTAQLSLLYAALSFLCGILISYILEIILQKGTKVDFDMPTNISEKDLTSLKKKQSIKDKHVPVYLDSKGERHIADGEIVLNPVLDEEKKQIEYKEMSLISISVPEDSFEIKTVSGNTRALSKKSFYIDEETKKHLNSMGLMSGIAIAIHNIPEGMISYIGYLDNPVVGFALAIGIAAHNIPEGLSVALPIFYATGSRGKAFLWSLLSGLAEPVGALLCMLVLGNYMNDIIYGILFGLTCGIMIYISIFELLPTGITLDCEKNYTTISMLVGFMFILITFILVA